MRLSYQFSRKHYSKNRKLLTVNYFNDIIYAAAPQVESHLLPQRVQSSQQNEQCVHDKICAVPDLMKL